MSSLHEYTAALRVDKHRLDDELEVQAESQYHISQEVARKNSDVQAAKDALAAVEARLTLDLKSHEPKLTAEQLKALVQRHRDRAAAWQAWAAAREEYEMWLGLLEAWRQKGYALSKLAELHGQQYYAPSSTSDDRRLALRRSSEMARRHSAEERIAEHEDARPRTRRRMRE